MDIMGSFIEEIFPTVCFQGEQLNIVDSKFEEIYLNKGEIILHAGDHVRHQYYIRQGCLRTYYIDPAGKEHTIQFAIKDWWISDFTAFFNSSRAIMNIECIEKAIVYKVSREDMETLYKVVPEMETFFRRKMEIAFASFQKRILCSLALTAKERYIDFIQSYPNIEQIVKNYHIASYLGITTESLSRIRKEIANN